MGFAQQEDAALDPGFRVQVANALTGTALDVVNEAGTVPGHVARLNFAAMVLSYGLSPDRLTAVARACANDGVTVVGATDAQVLSRVEYLWSALAGAGS